MDDTYQPNIKINVHLGTDSAKKVHVTTTSRTANGSITPFPPKEGWLDQVDASCRVIPVLRTAGVWIRVKAKKAEFDYGLCFEASDLLVVEEEAKCGAGINFGGLVDIDSEEEDRVETCVADEL